MKGGRASSETTVSRRRSPLRVWRAAALVFGPAAMLLLLASHSLAISASPASGASPSAPPSTSPSASPSASPLSSPSRGQPPVPAGGSWNVNGADVKLQGALAGQVAAGGSTLSAGASAAKGIWATRLALQGDGPVSVNASISGPGPVIDAQVKVFSIPVSIQGTPGKDLTLSLGPRGRSSGSRIGDAILAAALGTAPVAATTPQQVLDQAGGDWLRGFVAFTVVGLLLLLVAPGLRTRPIASRPSAVLGRLGLGLILLIDIPLASLLVVAIGFPLGLWWLGLVLLLAFVVLLLAAYAYTGAQIGALLLDLIGYRSWLLAVPLGVALVTLVGLVPYIGPVVSLLATLFGIGSLMIGPRAAPVTVTAPQEEIAPRPAEQPAPAGRPIVE